MADPINSVAVATGSLVVNGTLTSFVAAEGDLFLAGGAVAPIASRQGNNRLTLAQPWGGPTLSGSVAWSILSLGPYWRSTITVAKAVADLIGRWDVASPFKFDAYGTLAQRDGYNNQPKGFVYLALEDMSVRLYIKLANTNSSSDWSQPVIIGSGGQVDFEEAVETERTARISRDAELLGLIQTVQGLIDLTLRADLNAEIARSTGKDTQHDGLLSGLRTDLSAEVGRATGKDSQHDGLLSGLRTDLGAEVARATGKDGQHDGLLSGLRTDLGSEVSRSTGKDTQHDGLLSSLRTDLTAEAVQARAAEGALAYRATGLEAFDADHFPAAPSNGDNALPLRLGNRLLGYFDVLTGSFLLEALALYLGGGLSSLRTNGDTATVLLTEDGRELLSFGREGTATVRALTLQGGGGGLSSVRTNGDSLAAFLTENGQELLSIGRDGAAAVRALTFQRGGGVEPLRSAERHSAPVMLTDDGYVIPQASDGEFENTWALRRMRAFVGMRRRGLAMQCVIGVIGDSRTNPRYCYIGALADRLVAEFGDAGGGFIEFTAALIDGVPYPSARDGYVITIANPSAWTETVYTRPTAQLGSLKAVSTGARVRVQGPAGNTAARLFGIAGGAVRYSWNGGTTWTALSLTGTGPGTWAMSGLPAGAFDLLIEDTSGSADLTGMLVSNAAPGIRVDKLGTSGSTAQQWAAANWSVHHAALALDVVLIFLGTNDQGAARSPAQFGADLKTIINRARLASPKADIVLVGDYENARINNRYLMADYNVVSRNIARLMHCAYVDLRYAFGLPQINADIDYGPGSAVFPLLFDEIHIYTDLGGSLAAEVLYRLCMR